MESESTRQQKVGKQIQKDLSDIFLKECAELVRGVMVSVTDVKMSPDLSYAKVYVSIFPFAENGRIMEALESNNWRIRKALGTRIRNQIKNLPELTFFLDDSLEYLGKIDKLLE